eukprot:TRINITY_DN2105_c0_g1_i1.p1 TRINITY_DN2105_c0_g1~~TRINITY_DN2105_c0_g1_i1.p1  ORF type:complete len:119 (+),score=26.14 TRINITY_DN2105_c0_g1_i1:209-565(+)
MDKIARRMHWAVVGNHHKNPTAVRVVDHLRNCGKTVTAVTPSKGETLKGIEPLEAVNFIINPVVGIDVLNQVTELGVKHVWFQPGACSDELRESCKKHDISLYEGCVLVEMSAGSSSL